MLCVRYCYYHNLLIYVCQCYVYTLMFNFSQRVAWILAFVLLILFYLLEILFTLF